MIFEYSVGAFTLDNGAILLIDFFDTSKKIN